MRDRMPVQEKISSVTLTRGGEHYVFRFEQGNEADLFSALVESAEDENLNFTWLDVLLVLHQLNS